MSRYDYGRKVISFPADGREYEAVVNPEPRTPTPDMLIREVDGVEYGIFMPLGQIVSVVPNVNYIAHPVLRDRPAVTRMEKAVEAVLDLYVVIDPLGQVQAGPADMQACVEAAESYLRTHETPMVLYICNQQNGRPCGPAPVRTVTREETQS
jgi:hypothetical protein